MDRRHFLKNLFAVAVALLAAPRSALKELSSLFAPGGRFYHFAHAWDGDARRTWINGEEVFSERMTSLVMPPFTVLRGEGPSSKLYLASNEVLVMQDGCTIENLTITSVEDEISWTQISDDPPFEPPPRDPSFVVNSDIGEGEHLIDSWSLS